MILFKVDSDEPNCNNVKVKVECENEQKFIEEASSLLLAIGHDDKLRKGFLKALDLATFRLEDEK